MIDLDLDFDLELELNLDLAWLDLFGFLPRYCKRKDRPEGSGK